MRQYTLQYLQDNDWVRITAVYDSIKDVYYHAGVLLGNGNVIRMLARYSDDDGRWYTLKHDMGLFNPVNCPTSNKESYGT